MNLTGLKRRFPDGWWTLVFLGPYMLGFILFIAYPFYGSFRGSLLDWPMFGNDSFAGLDNYRELLGNGLFWKSLWNTVYYVILLVPLELGVALLLSMLVNRALAGRNFFRGIYFMPFVLSLAAIGLIWTWQFTPNYGLISRMLGFVGLPQLRWLHDEQLAMLALVIVSVWRNTGYYMVIFLAGLQNIPRELYEASRIDGAGAWRRFVHITWPLLTPTTFLSGIIAVILGFQVFDLSYIMTGGGPSRSTYTVLYFVYEHGFEKGTLGYASAGAVVMTFLLLLFTAVYFHMQRRWVHYETN